MPDSPSRALVPLRQALPVTGRARRETASPAGTRFDLVSEEIALRDSRQVERVLPDILGRALARCWIDPEFRAAFLADPLQTLADHRIHLPGTIRISVVTEGQTRPMVIVNEVCGGTQRRLLYLQLVMVAGR